MNRQTVSGLDETTRHRLLADEQRRVIVETLRTASPSGEITLEELAARLVRATARDGGEAVDDRRTLSRRLHHVHLPVLADAGLLEYDAETRQVRFGRARTVTESS
ncbi:DUF7344 domain-containing protein [Haloarcula onubensis]|uniref:DUF7344 domain-containing protein n=1 Tax=Haloarcula onubensis TaxID=2950539 RepID=A0ABU2FV22_9EURY|nr:hypothetical protein [Halomicroarcula sp. S3CR25-11]MDS0284618.1 hypothetical protein [Halomicroarcula sp. S3CR25-11]